MRPDWRRVQPPAAEASRREEDPSLQQRLLRRAPRPWEEIFLVIGSAAIVSVLLDALVDPPNDWLEMTARILGSGTRIVLAVLLGMWLGTRAWPARGRQLGTRILRRASREKVKPILFLTSHPDFRPSSARRVLEVVGFAAGTTVIVTWVLAVAGLRDLGISIPSNLYTLLALYGSFVLVPYWTFARMGLRRIDPVRWTVQPVSQTYAARLRLSNGALLLVALGAAVNLALRAGRQDDQAILEAVRLVGHLVAAILVVAAAAVAYYNRVEKRVVLELEKEALAAGVRDGRDLSDGDFLPRVL